MAFIRILFEALLLGVLAAAADDVTFSVPVEWRTWDRRWMTCEVGDADRLLGRRPRPPLLADDDQVFTPYVWRTNGGHFSDGEKSLEVLHDGVYQCGIKYHGGIVLGAPTNIKFISVDNLRVDPEHLTARSGQPAMFTCSGAIVPPGALVWIKDSQRLHSRERYHAVSNYLIITDLENADSGSFKCSYTFPNKTRRVSQPARLTVEDQSWDLGSELLDVRLDGNITAPRGTRVVLPCLVQGWPRPKLIWKQTPPGGLTGELEAVDEVLVLPSVALDQAGVYICMIEGQEAHRIYNVTVTEPVKITVAPDSKEVLRASTVRLKCSAIGVPEPTITWYKDGEPLELVGRIKLLRAVNGEHIELVISGVTSDDAGVYQCFASNPSSVASKWAVLNVTGVRSPAPRHVTCLPLSDHEVQLSWASPGDDIDVLAYTVDVTNEMTGATNTKPYTSTEGKFKVDPLAVYKFQVRTFETGGVKASDPSEPILCQGQGVPVKLSKLSNDSILVSWRQFASDNPGVVHWIVQYKVDDIVHNITLDGDIQDYALKVATSEEVQIRVLGSRTKDWQQQDLSLVRWRSTANADRDDGETVETVQSLQAVQVTAQALHVKWHCKTVCPNNYIFKVCYRSLDGFDENCQESFKTSMILDGLQPGTKYEVRVQARIVGGNQGPFSAPLSITTLSDSIKNLQASFVNATAIKVTWSAHDSILPSAYTVHHSHQLVLPMDEWAAINTTSNFVIIPVKSWQETYVMVTRWEPFGRSKILTVDVESKELHYTYTDNGVKVSWSGSGPRVVRYAQNIALPLESWKVASTTDTSIELTGLEPSQTTYVMVSTKISGRVYTDQSLTIPPRVEDHYTTYLALGIGCGLSLLIVLTATAICAWRRRKRQCSPTRIRRGNDAMQEQGSEMTNIGDRLANGGGSKDAGEPLLNGHVHITENPTSKTPNGKIKKATRFEAPFDLSRTDDHDNTMETTLDLDNTTYNLLDTSRRPEFESRSVSANNSFAKLPDDNMNSELTRSTDFQQKGNSKIQPTLQPNG